MATAIVAFSMMAIVGFLGPMSKKVAVTIDSEIGSRLATAVERELDRLGFRYVRDEILGNAPIYLYASRDGSIVRLGPPPGDEPSSVDLAVNRNLFGSEPVGIAKRDRFFMMTLRECRINDQQFSDETSGTVSLTASVEWPFRVPEGPASDANVSAGDPSFDPSALVPANERQSIVLYFSVTP